MKVTFYSKRLPHKQMKSLLIQLEFSRKFGYNHSQIAFIANKLEHKRQYKLENSYVTPKYNKYKNTVDNRITSCKSSSEVWDAINVKCDGKQIFDAIRKCATFNDHKMCWEIFEFSKKKCIISPELYFNMFWLLNYQNNLETLNKQNDTISKYYKLINEMNEYNIKPIYQIITSIFTLLMKYQLYNEAKRIFNTLKQTESELLTNQAVWNSFIDVNCKECLSSRHKKNSIKNILNIVNEMYNNYGIKPTDFTYCMLIAICARLLKQNKLKTANNNGIDYVSLATELFDQSKNILQRNPFSNVYSALIDVHGNVGDYKKCFELLDIVINNYLNRNKHNEKFKSMDNIIGKKDGFQNIIEYDDNIKINWNERTIRCALGGTIKGVINNDELTYEKGWELIDYITNDLMKNKCKLKLDIVIYGALFQALGSFEKEKISISKLKSIFKDMVSNGINPNQLILHNMTIVASKRFENDREKADKFAKFIVKQIAKYKIPVTMVLKLKLENMISFNNRKCNLILRDAVFI